MAIEFAPLRDGQRLAAGNVLVDVIHTPGHAPDSVCLLVRDLMDAIVRHNLGLAN